MKIYENRDNFRQREHTLEITIQSGGYKGKLISKPIGGNCFGIRILECVDEDIIYDIDDYTCVGCNINLIGDDEDGEEWFSYELADDEGNICTGEDYCRDFSNMIVGINIIKCEIVE